MKLPRWIHFGKDHRHLCRNAWCWTLEGCGCRCYLRHTEGQEAVKNARAALAQPTEGPFADSAPFSTAENTMGPENAAQPTEGQEREP